MTFHEVEGVLGFTLPDSARKFPAWWSNNTGTHVGVSAWRDAGFRTVRVDVPGERVTFVRDAVGVEDGAAPFSHRPAVEPEQAGGIFVPLDRLNRSAMRMIDDWAEEAGTNHADAIAALLNGAAAARRAQLLETLSVARMPSGHDSTILIREDRDAR
jgi:hypothetical protein